MWEICANYLLPRALKSCPKSNKLPNLVTLPCTEEEWKTDSSILLLNSLFSCSGVFFFRFRIWTRYGSRGSFPEMRRPKWSEKEISILVSRSPGKRFEIAVLFFRPIKKMLVRTRIAFPVTDVRWLPSSSIEIWKMLVLEIVALDMTVSFDPSPKVAFLYQEKLIDWSHTHLLTHVYFCGRYQK